MAVLPTWPAKGQGALGRQLSSSWCISLTGPLTVSGRFADSGPDAGPATFLSDEVVSDSVCGSSMALRSLLGTCGGDRVAASFHRSFLGGKSSSSSRILKSADGSGFRTEGLCTGECFQFPLS